VTGERVPAVGGTHTVPAPDSIARDYLLLSLRLDQLLPGTVDAYFGPRDLKAQVDMEQRPSPARLAEDAASLRERAPVAVGEPDRALWLDRQLVALETLALREAGRELPYVEEVRRCFDAPPGALPPTAYAEAHAALDAALPPGEDIRARRTAWDERFTVPVERLPAVIDALLPRLREASAALWPLPEGEQLDVRLVTQQPWSGYNWYDGARRSRVDLNTDLPLRAADLLDTLSHETFPGHHLEHAWKEARLVDEQRRVEATMLLVNTPEAYVSEGLAELGRRYSLPDPLRLELLALVYERAGIAAGADDALAQLRISAALRLIRGASGDAALKRHVAGESADAARDFLVEQALMTPERATKLVGFIEHPLWRTYVFSYAGGEALLGRWCDVDGPQDAPKRFFRLLTEHLTPSGMASELT
jgi:hypothetical protein